MNSPWTRLRLRVRKLRRDAGLTQVELGELLGVDRTHVSRIERGLSHPSLWQLVRLCERFRVSSHYLLGLED